MRQELIPTNYEPINTFDKFIGKETVYMFEQFLKGELTTIAVGLGAELDSSFTNHLERQGACVRIINLDDPGLEYHAPFGVFNTQKRLDEAMHNSHEKSVRLSDFKAKGYYNSGWTAQPNHKDKSMRTYQGAVIIEYLNQIASFPAGKITYVISISGYAAELDAFLCLLVAEFIGLIDSAVSEQSAKLIYHTHMTENKYLLAYRTKRELIRNANLS